MPRLIDIRIPDLGEFSQVAVTDVLVKPGDVIERDGSLITLETDKATMDVPSGVAGIIDTVHVAKGDKVSSNDAIATVRIEEGAATADVGSPPESGHRSGNSQPSNRDLSGGRGEGGTAGTYVRRRQGHRPPGCHLCLCHVA